MKTLFRNGHIWTMQPDKPRVQAVVIEDDRITHAGDDPGSISGAREIDLEGRVLLPAFTDTHTHFLEVVKLRFGVDLSECADLSEVREMLVAYRDRWAGRLPWMNGVGWNKNVWPSDEGWGREFLDDIFGDTPATFKSKDLHTKLCNTAALRAAGIDRNTPDPPSGKVHHDEHGEPNGFLGEQAWKLVQPAIPAIPFELLKEAAVETVGEMWKLGLGGVNMMEGKLAHRLFCELSCEGQRFRYVSHPPFRTLDTLIEQGVRSYTGESDWFETGGIKIFMDGSIGSHTAYMYDPYPTGDYGFPLMTTDELRELVFKAAAAGLGSTVHAIGDKMVHTVASVLAEARKAYPHILQRIEHAQCVRPEDIAMLADAQIYCAMQPIHIAMDAKITPKLWPVAHAYSYPIRTLLEAGVPVGFGSDAPVETINPFHGVYAAITRRYRNDPAEDTWMPHEALTVEQAIVGYTRDAARGAGMEDRLGQIAPGMLADLIVLDDFTTQPDEFWLTARSRLTMVGGEIVWRDME